MTNIRYLKWCLLSLALVSSLLAHGGNKHEKGSTNVTGDSGVSVDADALVKKELDLVRIDEKVGNTLNSDLKFHNHNGEEVRLADYISDRPVLLSFVYYSCPFFCQYVLAAEKKVIQQMGLQLGVDYDVVTISFDKNDSLKDAQKMHKQYALDLDKSGNQSKHWHFLYGDSKEINDITSQVGFHFKWVEANKEFAHSAAIYIISPDGKIARYFYGIDYNPFDVKLAIFDAKHEKTKSTTEKILLYCYRYDSSARGYSLQAKNIMKTGGVATIVIISGMLGVLIRRERRNKKDVGEKQLS